MEHIHGPAPQPPFSFLQGELPFLCLLVSLEVPLTFLLASSCLPGKESEGQMSLALSCLTHRQR